MNLLTLDLMFKENLAEDYLNVDSIKTKELETLSSFVGEIRKKYSKINIFNDYLYDYSIPQISKQFDILKVASDYIINIELKETSTYEKIKKQLKENSYYLRSTGREVWTFTYEKSSNSIYQYIAEEDRLDLITDFESFVNWLEGKQVSYLDDEDINGIFNPKQYLVSVFNDTEKFIRNEYFLNDLQQRFKKEFEDSGKLFHAIKGEAGTGKTLLLYDIAKDYKNRGESFSIIHCANLNIGHHKLKQKGWLITPIKNYLECLTTEYKAIFIDEAQRLKTFQLQNIINYARKNKIKIYFSYDPAQYLHYNEKTSDIANKILDLKSEVINKVLTGKIRNNKEISLFIKKLFDNQHNHTSNFQFRNFIEVIYFDQIKTANDYIIELIDSSKGEATILGFTHDRIKAREYERYNYVHSKLNAHEAIGQEFNHVVLTLGDFLNYDVEGKLCATCSSFYDVERMFYQLATRTKEKLTLIIVNNRVLALRALNVLNQ
ncbi:DNA/RNA helicase domain-containing protein [Rummeliibacillus sp. TYF-LIM-RU47]|uniref:DNA/RNA helicase domain-containing protein n=1 Tax=Rummeliibacillus sp. TYF-LIM-RU47 TaxID=2608406 RepID=UPI0012387A3E|nr:DNA/RNA helicase domain-containing protein [Rummeliibacillus sp. TYF-LIM-RU47]